MRYLLITDAAGFCGAYLDVPAAMAAAEGQPHWLWVQIVDAEAAAISHKGWRSEGRIFWAFVEHLEGVEWS